MLLLLSTIILLIITLIFSIFYCFCPCHHSWEHTQGLPDPCVLCPCPASGSRGELQVHQQTPKDWLQQLVLIRTGLLRAFELSQFLMSAVHQEQWFGLTGPGPRPQTCPIILSVWFPHGCHIIQGVWRGNICSSNCTTAGAGTGAGPDCSRQNNLLRNNLPWETC